MKPLNLRELFGERYKIELDESSFCPGESRKDPWYFQIACKYGNIYPHSDRLLAFCCESGRIRKRLHKKHPEIEVSQWSDIDEAVFIFEPHKFDIIAEYARPMKRRRLSDNERIRLASIGQGSLFDGQKCGVEISLDNQESTKISRVV